jgi:predicted nucleotidyltransferase
MNLQTILEPMVRLMERARISYAIIGGYAVAAWGEMRATRDVDLLCGVQDLGNLKSALKAAGYSFEHRTGDADDPISDVIRIDVGSAESAYEMDILAGIRGAPSGLLRRSRTVPFSGMELKVAAPEDMIVLKLLGGSALDVQDARGILRLQREAVDRELLRRICPDHLSGTLSELLRDIPLR